jgi:nucleotide-binding universal stress UspA family protein
MPSLNGSSPDGSQPGPVLLCDDGSVDAALAVTAAAVLLSAKQALVLHIWQSRSVTIAAMAGSQPVAVQPELDEQALQYAEGLARQAAERATEAGFDARPLAVEAVGPTWQVIIDVAHEHNAAVIVLGARGLSGVKHALLGSVSEKVVRHAARPVLVQHPRPADPRVEGTRSYAETVLGTSASPASADAG